GGDRGARAPRVGEAPAVDREHVVANAARSRGCRTGGGDAVRADAGGGGARGQERFGGARVGRKRNGQGAHRARAAPAVTPRGRSVSRRELRGDTRRLVGE